MGKRRIMGGCGTRRGRWDRGGSGERVPILRLVTAAGLASDTLERLDTQGAAHAALGAFTVRNLSRVDFVAARPLCDSLRIKIEICMYVLTGFSCSQLTVPIGDDQDGAARVKTLVKCAILLSGAKPLLETEQQDPSGLQAPSGDQVSSEVGKTEV
ncbi:hypothetical protein JCM10908_002455 [Rhodotorula pacifica]|uniref:uncharacterized protein n=1 Tax=Rhodotorula pacifica TaxID=1495444 RepID=UPI00317342E0